MRHDIHGSVLAPADTSSSPEDRRTGNGRLPVSYIVDEDPRICHFLSLILHGQGVRTEEYSDGRSFLRAVERHPGELVFLNIGRDSAEAMQLIETLGKQGYFGFVQLMSDRGSAVLEHAKRCAEQHKLIALPILTKPFQTEAIINILQTLKLGDASPLKPGEAPPIAARLGLAEALAKNWIEYWYQPKIDLRQKQLIGAEAFVRARRPNYGAMPPAAFMSDASESDLVSLAEHSLISALKAGSRFSDVGVNLRLAVNMSMNALVQLPVLDIVRSHRAKLDKWPGLIIDITEQQIVTDPELASDIAKRLMHLNVQLAIDDFGRGYSSLTRLKELPFAELKLDRVFVTNCGVDKTLAPICRTVIDLAHNFGSKAVAVGIEKATEAVALVSMGCDYGQGFLLGQPMLEDRFISLLRLRSGTSKASQPPPLKARH